MKPNEKPILRLAFLTPFLLAPLHGDVTAVDDGSGGSPFLTTNSNAPAWGGSVTANDTGTTVTPLAGPITSTEGAAVILLSDGTFYYDPRGVAAARLLASGASLTDTFDYMLTLGNVSSEATETLDATTAENTLTVTGLPAPVAATGTSIPSVVTSAYEFTGSNSADRTNFQQSPNDASTQDVTFEFWLKPDSVTADQIVMETGGSGDGSGVYLKSDGTLFWLIKNQGVSSIVSTTALTAGEWIHVAMTYNKDASGTTDEVRMYLNGVETDFDNSETALNDWSGTDACRFGAKAGTAGGQGAGDDPAPGVTNFGNFTGQLGAVRFYRDRVLSASEVSGNYLSAVVVDDTGTVTVQIDGVDDAPSAVDDLITGGVPGANLVSTEDLTANDGSTRTAAPGNRSDLILDYDANLSSSASVWENRGPIGGTTLDMEMGTGVSLNTSVTSAVPTIRQSYSFDGTADATGLFSTNTGADSFHELLSGTDSSNATFEFWAKPANTSQVMTLFETGGGTGIGMVIDNGVLEAAMELDGATKDGSYVSYDLVTDPLGLVGGDPTTDFNHYAAVARVGNSGMSLYVNGVLVDNTTAGNGSDWDGGDGFGLGRYGGDNHGGFVNGASGGTYDSPFLGEISSFRVYGAALNADQVERNYQAATNLLLLNYEAWTPGNNSDTWQNIGPVAGSSLDWRLGSGVTLNGAPGSSRAQITAAYDFDGTTDAFAVYGLSEGTNSIEDVVGDSIELQDVTVEAWVKLDVADQTQFTTIFEGGATQGLGLVVDNEVLIAATESDGATLSGSTVSYDLNADSLGVLGGQTTISEFFQVAVSVEVGEGLVLYVNGVKVDSSTGGVVDTDWIGGDGDGLGHFAGAGHGGFANPAGGGAYDTYLNGSIAALRLYGEVLGESDIRQNFEAVNNDTDVEGNIISVSGIFDDATGTVKTTGQTATLDSGATVVLDSATGAFTYNPNGIFDDLVADDLGYDRFTYQVTSASGTGTAEVVVVIEGLNEAAPDTIEATELLVTTYTANQIVGNDDHALGTSDAFLDLNANDVTPEDILAGTWRNTGRGGSTYDVNITSGTLIAPPVLESNFGAVGQSWKDVTGTFTSFQDISDDDATVEIWFQPTPLTTGRQLLMESGGNGNGMSIVYNADTAEVDFIIDGGNDNDDNIQVSATGIVPGEFNQLIAIYDKDSPTVEDTLTLYLNGDPTSFNGAANASETNLGGTTDNFSGSNGSGIGAVNSGEALELSFGLPGFPPTVSAAFEGQISIMRVYDRKLSIAEVEANFDAIAQSIQSVTGTGSPGSVVTTTLGATVTLNADGSFEYDSTGLADIPEGNVVMDSFDYTISDGAGGTTTATVTVNVTGVGSFLAVDDSFGVSQNDGPTAFNPLANDIGAEAAVVELQSDVSNFGASVPTGTVNGETADFRDGSDHGWQFLWNAPTGWSPGGSFDGTTGALGSEADYLPLVWDSTVGGWLVDADGFDSNALAEPGAYLRISPDGTGIPGLGSTQATLGNDKDRYLILAYTVDSDGYYGITDSGISVPSGSSGGITVETLVGSTPVATTPVAGGGSGNFDQLLGFVNADDTIYIAIGPDGSRASDYFSNLDFTLVKLPSAESQLDDILGTVSTDGSTITYDPAGAFTGLAAGQTVDETITYTIRDLSSELDYDGGTVAFNVGQTLTSSSGGSATILAVDGDATSGTLRLGVITGTINDNDTLTGSGGGSALANGTPVASTSVSTAEFTVTVTGENDAPTAVEDPLATTADEDLGVTGALSVLSNDTDPDQGDALTLVVAEVQSTPVSGPTVVATDQGGSLTMYEDGTFDYTPPVIFNPLSVGETATDTFTYLCEDSGGLQAAAPVTATITINGANDPVAATANAYTVDADDVASGNLITDDTGSGLDSSVDTNDTLTVSAVDTSATLGSVSFQSDGTFTYDPGCAFDTLAPGGSAIDTFVYTLSDGQGGTDTATVTITVDEDNVPPSVDDPSSLAQVVVGAGTVPLEDILVIDGDGTRSEVDTVATALFDFQNNVTVFSDLRPDDDGSFDVDAGGPSLTDADGFSVEITFVPQAADMTGTVVLFEFGGSSNGSSVLLVDGIPHLLSKAGSAAANEPTDDSLLDNVFQDLDWAGDSAIVVPLSTTPAVVGESNQVAVVYDISNDTVDYSMNGAAAGTATLLNNDSVDWNGDHTVNIGQGAGGGVGGNANSGSGPFRDNLMANPAWGPGAISCLSFWSEATGSVLTSAGESITATLTIQSWNGTDSLSSVTNNGGGVYTATGDAATVSATLAAMEFVPGVGVTYPVTITVSIDDGDEDGSGPVTGTIYITDTAPANVYVDDGFSGSFLDPIADADNGSPVSAALFGFDAFATIAEGLAAAGSTGTVVVNGGDYSGEDVSMTGNSAMRLTDAGESVSIGSVSAGPTNSIDLQNGDLTLGASDFASAIIDAPIAGTGTLTKVGTGDIRIRGACTYTGVTTIDDGRIVITYQNPSDRGSLASSGIVVNAPAILALGADDDTTYVHTNPISGDGSVSTFEDGTVEFNTPGGNTFSGGFDLGDGASSTFDGIAGAKQGFVVVNDNADLGTGKILSRGGQLQAGVGGIVISNDIDITGGGFRCGGAEDFTLSGSIATIDDANRGFGNYGSVDIDLTITGNIDNTGGNVLFQGNAGGTSGTWTVSGDISGPLGVEVSTNYNNGTVTLTGTNTYEGPTDVDAGNLVVDGTHTGGAAFTVSSGAFLAGSGSIASPVTVGGTLDPGGFDIATFTTGPLTVSGTVQIDVDNTAGAAGTAYDQVVVTGGVNVSGGSILVFEVGVEANPAPIVVIDNDTSVDAVLGTFIDGNPFSMDFLGSGKSGVVEYAGGDGNDIALVTSTIIESWRVANGLPIDGSLDEVDTDSDGLVSLLEFGFGTEVGVLDGGSLNPDGSVNGSPTTQISPGPLALFNRRDDFGQSGSVSYTVEFSSDLSMFYPNADTISIAADSTDDPDYHVASVPYPALLPDGKPARFFRVRVEVVP
ncbi:hypothetical protein HAHE_07050 [Haloferula helveola]|uniref:RapA2 cadherin-like domain-containing protein n=1 Tax=Haloferula helveola TaxID=490095 RepID=A0ABN6GZT3_9BACT|nr:hypothetical protein HAHE_07050 [Haloferula helveola]